MSVSADQYPWQDDDLAICCGVWVLNLPLCVRGGGCQTEEGRAVSLCCRVCRINGCTHLAVFLVLAPHLFAEAPGCLAGSVWGDDVVVDQSWQVSPHCGQVSTVCQPWRAHVHNSRVRMRRRLAPISLWNRFHRFFSYLPHVHVLYHQAKF